MAKLYYLSSVMNSGKSTHLLQSSDNYTSQGGRTFLISHKIDTRFGENVIASRIGLQAPCFPIDSSTDIRKVVDEDIRLNGEIDCVLADEIQFYTKEQIEQLADIVDELNIPVMAYGLRVDFKSHLFEGSKRMLELADEVRVLKTVCHCKKAANEILRFSPTGEVYKEGESILVGAESMYQSVCRKHWKEGNLGATTYKRLGIDNPFEKE